MSEIDLSIVIVNWNSADYVQACIRSIRAETKVTHYEIIVVDNASFDGCEQQIARHYPEAIFIQSAQNLGFSGANNLAARRARGRVLLFLNPDTEVRDGAIDRLCVSHGNIPDAGVVGCRLLNTDGSVQTTCARSLPTLLNQFLDADVLRRCAPRASLWGMGVLFEWTAAHAYVEAVSGACMLVRREVFESVSGFSEEFFMYGEDLDLCARVQGAGLKNVYVGCCEIVHHGGGSSGKVQSTFSVVMMCESKRLLFRRLRGIVPSICYQGVMTLAACIRLGILACTAPAWLVGGRGSAWRGAVRKWSVVLGWGVGLKRPEVPNIRQCSPASTA